jgi:hypothetical protein
MLMTLSTRLQIREAIGRQPVHPPQTLGIPLRHHPTEASSLPLPLMESTFRQILETVGQIRARRGQVGSVLRHQPAEQTW